MYSKSTLALVSGVQVFVPKNIRTFILLSVSLFFLIASNSFAQSGDVVISANTTWAAGEYHLNSLTVTNGATLTLQGANTTAQVNGEWAGYGVTINAVSVRVDAGSAISADGQGYTGGDTGAPGNGPGGGCGSVLYDSAGGSYGGLGCNGPPGCSAGPTYGSALTPTDLGSGGGGTTTCAGGSCWGAQVGGNGGGAIRLIVTGTLTNNGTISANGVNGRLNWPPLLENYAGGGSGGSIWVTAGTLTGSGTFTANGGVRYWGGQATVPGGGAGRVAVYSGDDSSFTGFNTSTANGGPGAQQGTVAFFNTSENSLLVAGPQIFIFDEDSSLAFQNITVRDGANLIIGGGSIVDVSGTVAVTGGAEITLQGKNASGQVDGQWVGEGVMISAANVQVDAGSAISADGQGYTGGDTGAPGNGPGGGCGSILYDSTGGSYGGLGYGAGSCSSAGPIYGSALTPTDLGSGGGGTTTSAGGVTSAADVGGNGGGAIRLIVTGTLTNNGTISANGVNGTPNWPPSLDNYAGGGSGGSIWATIGTLTGSGAFMANGGARYWGEQPTVPGGGGGRIAVYYATNSGFNPAALTADSGPGAEVGTVEFVSGVHFAVDTNPAGRSFTVDGDTYTSAQVFTWSIGSTHSIATMATQTGTPGTQYVFDTWSDGGALSHSVTAASQSTTYTATFNTQYQLTTAAAPSNAGAVTPLSGGFYDAGAVVDVSATPEADYMFSNWTGPVANSNASSTSVTMTGPISVTANFSAKMVEVTVGTNPAGRSFTVDGIGYTSAQTLTWTVGSTHTIGTTSPQAGTAGTQYVFANWSDGGAMSHSVTASSATISYTATFTTQYQLTTAVNPVGAGTVVPTSGGFYDAGAVVNISATSNSGFAFSNWTGSVADANAASTTVTMTAAASVTANFTANTVQVTVGTNPVGRSFTVDGIDYASAQILTWTAGSTHTIATNSPQAGAAGTQYVFGNWSDGGAMSHTVTGPPTNTTYTVTFNTQYQMTTTVAPPGSGTVTPPSGGFFNAGAVVNVSASPSSGFAFSNWTGPVADANAASTTATMSGPLTVTANFTPAAVTPAITLNPVDQGVVADQNVSFTAAATGTPTPTVQWQVSNSGSTAWADIAGATATTLSFTASGTQNGNRYRAVFTNSAGIATTTAATLTVSVRITVQTNLTAEYTTPFVPPTFTVDGVAYNSPQIFIWTIGSIHTLATTTPQVPAPGTRYVFYYWDDRFPIDSLTSHTVTAPAVNRRYTATFYNMQHLLTLAASPAEGGSVSSSPPSREGYYDRYATGAQILLTATPNTGYAFTHWTGDITGTANPQLIGSMVAPMSVTAHFARTVQATVGTNPPGLSFTVDGAAYTGTQILNWVPGTTHTISTQSPQGGAGTQQVFANWSDGGAMSHTVTAPSANINYTANFITQYQLTTAAAPPGAGTITPASGGFYNSGSIVSVSAVPAAGFAFTNWTGPVANPSAAGTTVTVNSPVSVTANFTSTLPQFTVETNPPGLSITVDNNTYTGTQVFAWVPGSTHTISTTATQAGPPGTQYVFANWSDGGNRAHRVTAPAQSTAWRANFTTQYQLTTEVLPAGAGRVTPASGGFYDAGTVVTVSAVTSKAAYRFWYWTGPVANEYLATTTVTMAEPVSITAKFLTTVTIPFRTLPAGMTYTVDGVTYSGYQHLGWEEGSTHTVSTTAMQGTQLCSTYAFRYWQDDATGRRWTDLTFTATVPPATGAPPPRTFYAAVFTHRDYHLSTSIQPPGSGAAPASGDYPECSVVHLAATASPGYTFSHWTGPAANPAKPTTSVTMNGDIDLVAYFSLTPPSGLAASLVSGGVQLSWSDNNVDEASFAIDRSPDRTNWTEIGTVPANNTTATLSNQPAGVLYYRVRSYNSAAGSSAPSNVVRIRVR